MRNTRSSYLVNKWLKNIAECDPKKLIGIKEKEIENEILTWLNLQPNCFAFKINTMGVYDPNKKVFRKNKNRFIPIGCSDILGLYKSKFIAIEVKTPKTYSSLVKHPLKPQNIFLQRVISMGGIAFPTYSLEHTIEKLKAI